ncbi:fungal-specific transcription factor domain-containing protein [Truncatella angustata]|uniref:Fungal-specific transcription factor domain-containing protein n=1 Tax=Truncatella angustata TaxID=152316 RepID=A0A9P8ZZH8_9PEZI|nr:fungal-specific transcription factor domain-containing protein [Truncatella angustata]KAH6655090.1 fungal-specific transcription factor domain-containing protein [Truncatella angustata]
MDHLRVDPNGFQIPGMHVPQLTNQPPQIFGAYGMPDGLSMLPPELQMFDPSALMGDDQDAKRRRIARACDMCRKKKIKCDGKLPACTHCINYKTDCVFTQVEKKRSPPKGAKYIEGLENRLGRMESLLRLAGLLDDEDGATDLGTLEKKLTEKAQQRSRQASHVTSNPTSPSQATSIQDDMTSTPQSALTSPEPQKDNQKDKDDDKRRNSSVAPERNEEDVEALSDMMCSLVTTHNGETRYIGSSSGFSIFSPKGIEWVNARTGDNAFQNMISEVSIDDHKWTRWKPEIFADVFRRPVYIPLPPKPEAMSLLKDYFENFNCMFPLFHQPTFMHLVEKQYSNEPYEGSGWWASLNVALATAHRLRVMSKLVPEEEDSKAWAYMKNAMGVFSELTMRNTDLLSVQALLGMALFMQGTPNPQPGFLLIAAAIRLSHSIGLHKRGSGFHLNPIETEQRKRVFWIAYMLDKELCLRAGRPPAQDDDDMNVELPDADPADNIGNIPLADGKGKMNLFRVMCELTVIEGQVYKRLYSTKAAKLSEGELLNTIGELDKDLEDWKDGIPIDFRPEHEIKASHTPLILHIVMLHFSYYNCLTTIHRMSVHRGYWTSRLSNYAIQGLNSKPLNPRVFASAALCASAARATISMLKYIPQGDNQCVWLALYFPVSALMTLFGNILQNPLDPRAKSDTKLMDIVVTFLSTLGQEAETGGVHRMLGVCAEFARIAKMIIDKTEKEGSKRKRRTQDPPKPANPTPAPQSNTTPRPVSSQTTPTPHYNQHKQQGLSSPPVSSPGHMRRSQTPQSNSNYHSPMNTANSGSGSAPRDGPNAWPQDYPSTGPIYDTPDFNNFHDLTGFGQPIASPPMQNPNAAGFMPALLPQDMWQLPMNIDWDWQEFAGGALPNFENGNAMPHGGGM